MGVATEPFPLPRRERLRYMEATLMWEGSFQRSQVASVFDVHVASVTDDIAAYENKYADHLKYDQRQKCYLPGTKFKPEIASADPSEYLALLLAFAETGSSAVLPLLAGADNIAVALPSPAPVLDGEVLKITLQAIRRQKGFNAVYHSTRAPAPETVELWPHSLFYTGIRWFVRAYNRKTQKFRNYAMQRLEKAKFIDEFPPVTRHEDSDWVQEVEVEVAPNPGLDQHNKDIVAREFAMKKSSGEYVWKIKVRRCLVWFLVNRYRLDDEKPELPRNRVVLKNRKELQALLNAGP